MTNGTPAEAEWQRLTEARTPLITTSLVLIELGDGLSRIHLRTLAIAVYDRLHASPRCEILEPTSDQIAQGWDLFRNRPDKEWGMTDCVSFVIMQERRLDQAFTLDHHFAQAGFRVLLS